MPGCPIRKSADLMLVCSSPQLIAAYHVLHRLLEPRHPPCALICFKINTDFKESYLHSKSYSVLQLFPNMSKSYSPLGDSLMFRLRTYRPSQLRDITSSLISKRTSFFLQQPLHSCGGYRSRTDDPLLAKQVL